MYLINSEKYQKIKVRNEAVTWLVADLNLGSHEHNSSLYIDMLAILRRQNLIKNLLWSKKVLFNLF